MSTEPPDYSTAYIELITLEQAKRHLRVEDADHDADIQEKVEQASDIVLNLLKYKSIPVEWWIGSPPTDYAVPPRIQNLACLAVSELYFNREASVIQVVTAAFMALAERDRDPALA